MIQMLTTEIVHLPIVHSQNVKGGQGWKVKLQQIKNPSHLQCSCQALCSALVIDVGHSPGVVQLDPDWVTLEKKSNPMKEGEMDCSEFQDVDGMPGFLLGLLTLN